MKKILTCFAALSALVSLTQCAKEMISESSSSENDAKKVRIVFSAGADSKSLISDDGENLKFSWENGDKLYVYDGNSYCGELVLNSESGGKESGVFEGKINPPVTDEIRFFYFGNQLTAPTEDGNLTLDVKSQERTLPWIQSHLIASYQCEYVGAGNYQGDMKVAYAVGKITLGTGYTSGNTIGIRTFKQKICVSCKGDLSYSDSEDLDIQQFKPSDNTFYCVMPSGMAADKLSICNITGNTYKYFDTKIENNVYYKATADMTSQECIVRYWADCGDGLKRLEYYDYDLDKKEVITVPVGDIIETGLYHNIIAIEPFHKDEGDVVKTFLGWSTEQNDTEGRYISAIRKSDLRHTVSTTGKVQTEGEDAGKVVINLYAVWGKIIVDGPYVDYEHYYFSTINRFKSLDSLAFNQCITFQNKTDFGFEKFNVPIRNLVPGEWYKLTFGEKMGRPDSFASSSWWNKDSCYSTMVSDKINAEVTIKSMLPHCTEGSPLAYVWVHSEGLFNDSPYTQVDSASIVFKAKDKTMWWIWDLSKQRDKQYYITYHFHNQPIEKITLPTGPNVHFLETALYNFRFKQKEENPTYKSSWEEINGYSTYKVYAEDNKTIEFHTFGKEDENLTVHCGKVNVPILGLEQGQRYKLKFKYEIENIGKQTNTSENSIFRSTSADSSNGYDFCYGISADENTSNEPKFHGTETPFTGEVGYSKNLTNANFTGTQTFIVEQEFTASESQMYLVLSMSNFKPLIRFKHVISEVSLTEVSVQ